MFKSLIGGLTGVPSPGMYGDSRGSGSTAAAIGRMCAEKIGVTSWVCQRHHSDGIFAARIAGICELIGHRPDRRLSETYGLNLGLCRLGPLKEICVASFR